MNGPPIFREGAGLHIIGIAIGVILTIILGYIVSSNAAMKEELRQDGLDIVALKVNDKNLTDGMAEIQRRIEGEMNSIAQAQISISSSLESLREENIGHTSAINTIKDHLLDLQKNVGDIVDIIRPIRPSNEH